MPKNRNRPRKRPSPKKRHGFPPAPERPSSERGKPFPKGNTIGLPTRFQPGKSPNPGGVPKDVKEFRALMQLRTEVSLQRVDDILDHGTERGIIEVSKEVWANGWGKPTVRIEQSGPAGGPIEVKAVLTSDERRARAAALIAQAAARAGAKKAGAKG